MKEECDEFNVPCVNGGVFHGPCPGSHEAELGVPEMRRPDKAWRCSEDRGREEDGTWMMQRARDAPALKGRGADENAVREEEYHRDVVASLREVWNENYDGRNEGRHEAVDEFAVNRDLQSGFPRSAVWAYSSLSNLPNSCH